MYLQALISLAVLSLAAAQEDVRGVIYTKRYYEGISFKIRSSNCIKLRSKLTENIHSIKVTPGQECTLYYELGCAADESEPLVSSSNVPFLFDTKVKSVRCVPDVGNDL